MTSRNISTIALIVGGLVLAANTPVAAPSVPEGEGFVLPSGSIPAAIFGIACVKRDGDTTYAPRLECRGADASRDPSIMVSVVGSDCQRTTQQLIEDRRAAINDGTPFFNVVWEREFLPASVPDGVGYKGFYQLSMGNRYWWETCGSGRHTRVSVIMFAPVDNEALKAEVEEKVFGVSRTNPDRS